MTMMFVHFNHPSLSTLIHPSLHFSPLLHSFRFRLPPLLIIPSLLPPVTTGKATTLLVHSLFSPPLFHHPPIYPSTTKKPHFSLSIQLVIYLSIRPSFYYLPIYPSIHTSIHPSIHSSIHPLIHPSIHHPFSHLPIHPTTHPSIHPSIHPSSRSTLVKSRWWPS